MKKYSKLVCCTVSAALIFGGSLAISSPGFADDIPAECKVDCGAKARCDKECKQKAQDACKKDECKDGKIEIKHGCDSDGNCFHDTASCKKTKEMRGGMSSSDSSDPCPTTPVVPPIGIPYFDHDFGR